MMKTTKPRFKKVFWLVLDSVGAGEMPDADRYGDRGANTLGNIARTRGALSLPHLGRLGLGNITPIAGTPPVPHADGHWGRMAERSPGKDTTTGHWEMAGVSSSEPFGMFPDGFPPEILDPFVTETGLGVIGNCAASGTEIIERLGAQHQATRKWIVYTSADSVFQIAAHEETVPLEELYAGCEAARRILDPYRVARVIARPFVGHPGSYKRTYNRRDFSMPPPRPTVLDRLSEAGISVVGVGKIFDIFAGRGVTRSVHTEGNTDGLRQSEEALKSLEQGLVFTNLVDFDMVYGHRRDPEGYARALEEVDAFLPRLLDAVGPEGLVIIMADHGCDPTSTWSTDHTREYVPLLVWHPKMTRGEGLDLGTRNTFADAGQTVAWALGITPIDEGTSLL